MRALVTGATGFLGSHVASHLVREGWRVRLLMRSSSPETPAGCEAAIGDLLDPESLRRATRDVEVVYHCAALVSDWGPRRSFREVNREGVRRLLGACAAAGVRRFVQVSTLDVLGHRDGVLRENAPPARTGFAYVDTKGEAEELVRGLAPSSGLDYSIVRPGWIYGPGDRHFLPEIVTALRKGNAVLIASGRPPAPVVFVGNVVPALVRAGWVEGASGRAFHLVDEPMPTWAGFIQRIARLIGARAPRFSLPTSLAYACALFFESGARLACRQTRPLLTRYLVRYWSANFQVETAGAREVLGFRSAIDLEAGLQRSLAALG